jgi:hypothetical protein
VQLKLQKQREKRREENKEMEKEKKRNKTVLETPWKVCAHFRDLSRR